MLPELEARAQELKTHRETFTNFLRGLDEVKLDEQGVDGEYSPKQALAHLVGAEVSMLRMAKNWLAGQETKIRPDFDLNFFNRRQQEKRAHQTVEDLLSEWERAQNELIALMDTLMPDDMERRGDHPRANGTTLGNLFLIVTTHEDEHIGKVMDSTHA